MLENLREQPLRQQGHTCCGRNFVCGDGLLHDERFGLL